MLPVLEAIEAEDDKGKPREVSLVSRHFLHIVIYYN